ncbi:hypothetical protein ACFWUQ_26325 [Streptomyces sp. NPDC058662]|uniref:hypothetical protein n=1 Tax=Streptomyces sp. NPDC058662 TaxID=3346583 RepID=UPI0036493967
MLNRRLVMSAAAVVTASIALIPGTAQAADPVKPAAQAVSTPAVDLKKAAAAAFQPATSPAGRTVRQAAPAARSGAAAAPQSADTAQDVTIGLTAEGTSGRGLELTFDITSPDARLDVEILWGDGYKDSAASYGSSTTVRPHLYTEVGVYEVEVVVTDHDTNAKYANSVTFATWGSEFTPYGPTRLLDTRNGTGAVRAPARPYSSTRLKVGGNGGIPADATAVALNVTVTNSSAAGHVTVFPAGTDRPTTSNVNYEARQTVPNLVIVPVGEDGYVELYNGGWESVDLLADVTGYFSNKASSGYVPLNPVRAVDTRAGLGAAKAPVAGQSSFDVKISGANSIPYGLKAVALNVTVTAPKEAGHLTVYPTGQAAPSTSNVNFTAGQTVANSVIVPVGPDGRISIRNGAWNTTEVVVDVVGYYTPESWNTFVPVLPERLLDTRSADWGLGPLPGREYLPLPVSPDVVGITGYALNTTVTNTRGDGFLSVAPDPNTAAQYDNRTAVVPPRPVSSALNWTRGRTVPNLVQASAGDTGIVDFWNQGWDDADVIVDIFGYYDNK